MSIDLGSQQIPMQNKQATPMEPMSNDLGTPVSNAKMTQLASPSSNPGIQPASKRSVQRISMPKNLGPKQTSFKNRKVSHVESVNSNLGSPQPLSSSNKRTAQMEPSPKGQTESSESVRAKLRESLADSLAFGCKQQNQAAQNNSQDEAANSSKQGDEVPPLPDLTSTSVVVNSANISEMASKVDDVAQKDSKDEGVPKVNQSTSQETLDSNNNGDVVPNLKSEGQDHHFNYVSLEEDVSFENNFFARDELLQGNGLCWVSDLEAQTAHSGDAHSAKRPKLVHEIDGDGKSQSSMQVLATRIEAELFKLYGGVNKKYKEKARSLLFNLKDRSNPELRERVLSGDIAPDRLCSMTAEELASKELSQWRIAKAEELAHMVVLPDSDVDVRRLVKKTHKGEFEVEFEQDDGTSVEVAVGSSSLPQFRDKNSEKDHKVASEPNEHTSSNANERGKSSSEDQNFQSSPTRHPDDSTDLMQSLITDELKDASFLAPIVSLDEFMESLRSAPPFENISTDSGNDKLNSDEKDISDVGSKLEVPDHSATKNIDTTPDKLNKLDAKSMKMDNKLKSYHISRESETSTAGSPTHDVKANHIHSESFRSAVITPKPEHVWEGILQLNVSSMVTVVGSFKSGERTTAKEWTNFLDVKGRVRCDAFEKFLQELPMSRSRAVMIVHFCWKEGSPESGRANLSEVIDSYIIDERVGFAEPAPGVELYLCPPYGKTLEMLGKHLSKDHTETLNAIKDGLIGVVVWRKPHVTSARKQHNSSARREHEKNTNSNISKEFSHSRGINAPNPVAQVDDDIDDIPPGFGPASVAGREEDDLPEFDFSSGSNLPVTNQPHQVQTPVRPIRPVEQMRELIYKYGSDGMAKRGAGVDDDEDDIPEWQPQPLNQQMPQSQLPLPPPPPPPLPFNPPLQVMHNFQPPTFPPQEFVQMQQFPPYPNQHHAMPLQPPMQHMQPINIMQGQRAINPWPQGVPYTPQLGLHPTPIQGNVMMPNFGGQPPGFVGGQTGGDWRLDANRNRGF